VFNERLQALNSPQRLEAIRALAEMSLNDGERQRLIARLLALLEDEDATVRAAAARALGQLNAHEGERALKRLAEADASTAVRESAREALNRLSPPLPRPQVAPQFAIPAVEIPIPPPSSPPLPGGTVTRGVPVEDVQFSAYYPRDVRPDEWYSMTGYIYKSSAALAVVEDAQKLFGTMMATVRRVVEAAKQTLPEGTMITATPFLQGFQFNPPSLTIGFFEDWHRLDFKLRAVDAPLEQATNGIMTFTVEGVIVADIPLSIYVGTTNSTSDMMTMTQKLYKAIFCSYSHDDAQIVERVERAYKILGFDFLRDVRTLKSGQDWNEGLYKLIEQADIFQLFWSETAAQSEFVEREWRYALSLDRNETNFIRPVYWKEPMPPVPDELDEIHFAYEPALDD
jgi:hypothetical protein